jgi:DNA-binding MarR family transcriptional regulator
MKTNPSSKLPIMSRMGIVFLTWRRYLQRQVLPYGITLKQEFVLHQLENRPYLNPAEIAELLFCDRPTATVIINNLAKQGWVSRSKDPENQKYIRISLTQAGRGKVAELRQMPAEAFDPIDSLTADEKTQLEAILKKLQKAMEDHGLNPSGEQAD